MRADDIGGESALARHPGVASVEVSGEMILVQEHSGRSHVLNGPGALVWQCLDGESSLAEIAADVADVFGVSLEVALSQLVALARNLGQVGMLAGVGAHIAHVPIEIQQVDALGCDDGATLAAPSPSKGGRKFLEVRPNA